MPSEETDLFLHEVKLFIHQLATSAEYPNDIALQRIVQILETLTTKSDLKKQKDIINRIAIDSVENWDSIKMIGEFLKAKI